LKRKDLMSKPKPKWWILNLKGEWNLINPQPSLDEDEFEVA
jgi:hypothetical protein